ncbi:MAG: HNH endonuclease [Nanoarchaeota archaeon]
MTFNKGHKFYGGGWPKGRKRTGEIHVGSLGKHWKLSEESRKNQSTAKKGFKHTEKTKKIMRDNTKQLWKDGVFNNRKIDYKETAKKISATQRGISIDEWDGFVRVRKYSIEFFNKRKYVKQRDIFTCQLCGDINSILDIHHIDYNKNNNDLNNLITLCHSCHSKTNSNREDWLNHFKNRNQKEVNMSIKKINNG